MQFLYSAKTQEGNLVEGKIEAPSEDQAVNVLHQKNLVVLSLDLAQRGLFSQDLGSFFNKPSQKDLVLFTRQLATLVDADVPLVEGLHAIAYQVEKESFRKVVNTISSAMEGGGASLSLALSEHDKIFSKFFVSLVRAGEKAGKLQTALLYLADYLERSASLNSKIKSALAYPAFVLFAMVIVGIIMITTVLPQLLSIIRDAGVKDIPLTTKMLIGVTDFFNQFFIVIVMGLLVLIIGSYYYLKTPNGEARWDSIKINLPRFGTVIRNLYLARIAETLATLVKANVPILEAINITSEVVGNIVYRDILIEARASLQGGGTISEALSRYKEIPLLVTSMLSIGEKTSRTASMLENIFNFYKTSAETDIQNLSQLIEPVLILVLGLGVGVLVSAILLPIYSLVGVS